MSEFTWGTVTAVGPLRVRLDGDAAALPITPDSLIDPTVLAVTDRVRCEISNNRMIVLGRGGGLLRASDVEALARTLTTRFITPANLAALVASDTLVGMLELATPAEAQAMVDAIRAVTPADLLMPHVRMGRSGTALSIANNSVTNITAATYWTQTVSGFPVPAGTIVAPLTGRYMISVALRFALGTVGTREIFVNKNNATYTTGPLLHAHVTTSPEVMGAREVYLTAGDALRVWAYQAQGSAQNVTTDADISWVSVRYLGP